MTGTRQTNPGGRHRVVVPPREARPPRFGSRASRAVLAGGLAVASVTGGIVVAQSANAAPAAFPDNVVVFPNRDFVTVEGYQDHIGETATITVTRGTTVMGSAQGVVEEGDVAFEVNHPGGYCWGAGTGVNVTPDIRPGDVVSIDFNGVEGGDTTVGDAYVTDAGKAALVPGSSTVVEVKGYIDPTKVNAAQVEQRIVNPDLTPTSVARRDIRAVPGPLTPAARGGYSSSLTISGTAFTARYEFTGPDAASVAATVVKGGGERFMSWQVEDADANRQGLTIAELGEPGGPGMGGCPAGPADVAAPKGSASFVRSGADMTVNWTPPDAIPGAAQLTGYQVTATSAADGSIIGKKVGTAAPYSTKLTGLATGDYTVEVRSAAGPVLSEPFTMANPTTAPAPDGPVGTPVTVTLSVPTPTGPVSSVTATASTGAEVYYTMEPTSVLQGEFPSADAALAKGGVIPVTASGTLNVVAFDRAGNRSDVVQVPVTVAANPAPGAPTVTSATAGELSANVAWTAPTSASTITAYTVTAAPTDTTKPTVTKGVTGTTLNTSVTGLLAGTPYRISVVATNASGKGAEGVAASTVTPLPASKDTVTIGTAKWKTGDFRVTGTSTFATGTISVRTGSAAGPVVMSGPLTAAVAPATGGTYDIRLRTGVPTRNPGTVWVTSSNGGVAGPFTVTNG